MIDRSINNMLLFFALKRPAVESYIHILQGVEATGWLSFSPLSSAAYGKHHVNDAQCIVPSLFCSSTSVRYVSSGGNTIDQEAECAGWQGEGGEGHSQDLPFPGLNK